MDNLDVSLVHFDPYLGIPHK